MVPEGCAERRAVTPPSFVHRAAPSPRPGSPAGLSTYQASGHVDHFTRSRLRPRWEGAAVTCTHILEGALFWKEAPCSSPERGFQGTRRPHPGVPQSRGAVAPAPSFRCPSGGVSPTSLRPRRAPELYLLAASREAM